MSHDFRKVFTIFSIRCQIILMTSVNFFSPMWSSHETRYWVKQMKCRPIKEFQSVLEPGATYNQTLWGIHRTCRVFWYQIQVTHFPNAYRPPGTTAFLFPFHSLYTYLSGKMLLQCIWQFNVRFSGNNLKKTEFV